MLLSPLVLRHYFRHSIRVRWNMNCPQTCTKYINTLLSAIYLTLWTDCHKFFCSRRYVFLVSNMYTNEKGNMGACLSSGICTRNFRANSSTYLNIAIVCSHQKLACMIGVDGSGIRFWGHDYDRCLSCLVCGL